MIELKPDEADSRPRDEQNKDKGLLPGIVALLPPAVLMSLSCGICLLSFVVFSQHSVMCLQQTSNLIGLPVRPIALRLGLSTQLTRRNKNEADAQGRSLFLSGVVSTGLGEDIDAPMTLQRVDLWIYVIKYSRMR